MAGSRDSRGFRDYPDVARNNHYRVNEHFDTQWNRCRITTKITRRTASAHSVARGPLDRMGPFNAAHPRGPGSPCEQPPAWLLEDAKGLFNATGAMPGHPMARTGLFIPLTGKQTGGSRTCALAYRRSDGYGFALYTVTGDRQYETWYQTWWATALST